MDAQQPKDRYAWLDQVIAEQRRLHGERVMALIEAAAQAEQEIDIEELDQGRDSSAR
jgi:hypothetical protein